MLLLQDLSHDETIFKILCFNFLLICCYRSKYFTAIVSLFTNLNVNEMLNYVRVKICSRYPKNHIPLHNAPEKLKLKDTHLILSEGFGLADMVSALVVQSEPCVIQRLMEPTGHGDCL